MTFKFVIKPRRVPSGGNQAFMVAMTGIIHQQPAEVGNNNENYTSILLYAFMMTSELVFQFISSTYQLYIFFLGTRSCNFNHKGCHSTILRPGQTLMLLLVYKDNAFFNKCYIGSILLFPLRPYMVFKFYLYNLQKPLIDDILKPNNQFTLAEGTVFQMMNHHKRFLSAKKY